MNETAKADDLRQIFKSAPAGNARVSIEVIFTTTPTIQILLPDSYHIHAETRSQLLGVPGIIGIEDL